MDFSKNVLHAVGDNDKRENNENVTLGECDKIKLRMHVSSEEEAYNLYNGYALKKGFSIQKGVRRMVNGVIRQREYLCSEEGFKETGCCARIRFDVKNDIWSVSHFNDAHNHEFASPDERCNLRSRRKVLSIHWSIISTMVSSGIKATKSYSYLSKEVGGANNVGFTKRDVHNYLRTTRKEMIEARDGQNQAMTNAIKVVFSKSRHRLCLWHISKNARQHLAGLYSSQDFYARFNKCFNWCMTVIEFKSTWREMIEKHNLQNHAWLNRLYQIREKWCPAFSVDFFSAKMNVFHQIMKTSMPLIQVIQFYEIKATQMRQDEIDDD
ncbi:protein FAR1-RELATED SEQUENCE 5-like [Fagus crenata]